MNCIVFVGKLDKQSLNEITRISEVQGADIYWAYEETEKTKGITRNQINNLKNTSKVIEYKYNPSDIVLKSNTNFKNYACILFDDVFAQYDYVYLTHHDNHYSGKWQSLIDTLETSKANYLAPKLKTYPVERCTKWMWINNYLDNKKHSIDPHINLFVSSYAKFFRISKNALYFLKTYNECDIKKSFYELWVSTLLYNYNYTCEAIDTDMSDDQFKQNIKICNSESFECGVRTNKKKVKSLVSKYGCELLCDGWEESEHDIIIDSYWFGNKPSKPKYSIVIPVYNSASTLETCLESISKNKIGNSLYEIIIVDDGSTDGVCDIIEKIDCYYIYKKHTGIADTLNAGFSVARGEFIFVQMPATVMDADRLVMQSQKTIDNGWEYSFGSVFAHEAKSLYKEGEITREDLFNNDIAFVPGGLMVVNNANVGSFEEYFKDHFRKYACSRLLNNRIASRGGFISEVVAAGHNYDKYTQQDTDMVVRCYNYKEENPQLTCIINFRNEGIEVERTVQSIRATANNVSIILINDASDIKYEVFDYEHTALMFGCKYIKHTNSMGCGPSRDDGVANCKTPYFLLLDAHMRFYENGWDDRLVTLIPKYPGCIISANTSIIWKDDDGYYTNEDGTGDKANTYCCTLDIDESRLFDVKWTSRYVAQTNDRELYEVYCVLGAGYCSSVEHWKNMEGLKGLGIYGLDEGLMSFKTWAMGGHNYILRDLRIGHIYRASSPFSNTSDILEGARITLYHMFMEGETLKYYMDKLKNRLTSSCFAKAMKIYEANKLLVADTRRNLQGKLKYSIIDFVNANKAFLNIK